MILEELMVDVIIEGLEHVQKLTGVGGDKAADALQVIGTIINTLQGGATGKTTPDQVRAELLALVTDPAAIDLKNDAALHKKFDTTGGV